MLNSSNAKKASILSRMELSTVAYGWAGSATDLESRLGRMGRATRESGRIIRRTVAVSFTMSMEMSSMESGAMTRPMASAPISM